MIVDEKRKYKHVCPRNCASSCTLFSSVENDTLLHITGDRSHPYTNGKLCAKAFTYKELNEHRDRLKYPYYQKRKGSGKFTRISWEKAYELISNEMLKIQAQHRSFQSLALYKGTGNIGVHHYVADDFFASLGATKINGISSSLNNKSDLDFIDSMDTATLSHSSMIMIWGANPAATNIHLIPFLINAQIRGAKIVVIDPIHTKTAALADLFIPLRPNSDQALISLLTKLILENQVDDQKLTAQQKKAIHDFSNAVQGFEVDELLEQCDIPEETFKILLQSLLEAESISYILGSGLQKHRNGLETIQSIKSFAAIRGDINNIFMKNWNRPLFHNQLQKHGRSVCTSEIPSDMSSPEKKIDMLWITGGNPLIQEAHPNIFKQWMDSVPLIVTVDHFLTPTAQMSNLILPTTTFFEEMDIVISPWHDRMALNEKAVSPYFESRSEWRIMTDLARKIQTVAKDLCPFPIYSNEEQYLNAQFNDKVAALYSIKSIAELREKGGLASSFREHLKTEDEEKFQLPIPVNHHKGLRPTTEYPFWLITPHHPYKHSSQFHYLNLSHDKEESLEINSKVAKELKIKHGEIITIYNKQASLEIKVVYNDHLPKNILLFYQGWYPDSHITMNDLIPEQDCEPVLGIPLYDTFVQVKKYE